MKKPMPSPVRFLLAEDNEDHAELVRQVFEMHRLSNTVDHVTTGEDILEYLARRGPYADRPRPDVILLDINLPGMSGLDVLARVKSDPETKAIPVVIVTTSKTNRDRVRAYENYANSYVTKPVDFEQLHEIVSHLELYWTICNEAP